MFCFLPSGTIAGEFIRVIDAVQKKEISPQAIEALIKKGGDVNEKDEAGRTVLMLASIYHPVDSVHSVLINHGADVNARTPDTGQTALFFAVRYNNPSVVLIYLSRGCNPEIKDVFGRTAYDYAERNPKMKDSDILKLFPQYKERQETAVDAEASSDSGTSL